jgi:hypothetical protein
MKMNCSHVDTCLPDYWSGHHLPHVQIVAYNGMSFAAVRNAIRNELRQGAVMGSDDNARMLAGDLVRPDEEKRADAVTRAAYAAINRDVKPAKKGARNAFPRLEKTDSDDDACVYAYFVFSECDA